MINFKSTFESGVLVVDYKRLIIELVEKSQNNKILELVYRFCIKILD